MLFFDSQGHVHQVGEHRRRPQGTADLILGKPGWLKSDPGALTREAIPVRLGFSGFPGASMLYANLYLDKIDIGPYLTQEECRGAGASDCAMLAARLKAGLIRPEDCPNLSPGTRYAL
ncbi:MAG: hypothetical protein ABSA09_11315, partial [Desulfobaccales bacterium]